MFSKIFSNSRTKKAAKCFHITVSSACKAPLVTTSQSVGHFMSLSSNEKHDFQI